MAIENAALYARSDARLQEQTRRLVALIQSLDLGLVLADLEGKVLYANRMVGELSGEPLDEIIGQPVADWWRRVRERIAANDEEAQEASGKLAQLIAGASPESFILPLAYPDELRYLRVKSFSVHDEAQVEIGRGQILQDITRDYELDRMKSSLISTVSHELRTPLAAIKGYATTLLADDIDWDPERRREFLGTIVREANRLTQAAFAERIGISTSYLNQIENNQRSVSAAVLLALAPLWPWAPEERSTWHLETRMWARWCWPRPCPTVPR